MVFPPTHSSGQGPAQPHHQLKPRSGNPAMPEDAASPPRDNQHALNGGSPVLHVVGSEKGMSRRRATPDLSRRAGEGGGGQEGSGHHHDAVRLVAAVLQQNHEIELGYLREEKERLTSECSRLATRCLLLEGEIQDLKEEMEHRALQQERMEAQRGEEDAQLVNGTKDSMRAQWVKLRKAWENEMEVREQKARAEEAKAALAQRLNPPPHPQSPSPSTSLRRSPGLVSARAPSPFLHEKYLSRDVSPPLPSHDAISWALKGPQVPLARVRGVVQLAHALDRRLSRRQSRAWALYRWRSCCHQGQLMALAKLALAHTQRMAGCARLVNLLSRADMRRLARAFYRLAMEASTPRWSMDDLKPFISNTVRAIIEKRLGADMEQGLVREGRAAVFVRRVDDVLRRIQYRSMAKAFLRWAIGSAREGDFLQLRDELQMVYEKLKEAKYDMWGMRRRVVLGEKQGPEEGEEEEPGHDGLGQTVVPADSPEDASTTKGESTRRSGRRSRPIQSCGPCLAPPTSGGVKGGGDNEGCGCSTRHHPPDATSVLYG